MTEQIQIMVVEDHHIVRQGLIALLGTVPDMAVVAEASTAASAVELFDQHKPQITLMDLRLSQGSGVDAIIAIRKKHPEARFIVLTTFDGDEDIYKALQAGARGYLLKGMFGDELLDAIRAVHEGKTRIPSVIAERLAERLGGQSLTARELDVLKQIALGRSNKEIALELSISEATVKTHINSILSKLNVSDRTQAATTALQRGIVHLSERPL